MRIGHGHFFQNLDGRPDREVWRTEMTLADRAEHLGFDSVWAVEHHFADYSMSTDPLQFLTWVAARTQRVELGTMVSVLPWHDPIRLAEHACVLDHLSGGRLILGMGRGLARQEFDGFGVEMARSRQLFDQYAAELLDVFETGRIRGVELRPAPLAPLRGRVFASSISRVTASTIADTGTTTRRSRWWSSSTPVTRTATSRPGCSSRSSPITGRRSITTGSRMRRWPRYRAMSTTATSRARSPSTAASSSRTSWPGCSHGGRPTKSSSRPARSCAAPMPAASSSSRRSETWRPMLR